MLRSCGLKGARFGVALMKLVRKLRSWGAMLENVAGCLGDTGAEESFAWETGGHRPGGGWRSPPSMRFGEE